MSLALEQVDQAKNWRQARERLKDVHQVAYYDLPVIPLWQTIDSFAYRKNLQGIGATPVTLYQNVADWRTTYDERTR
jgi:ABC-type oligopeptide transport system substrate-binding subunit